jgi:hypothetical protein
MYSSVPRDFEPEWGGEEIVDRRVPLPLRAREIIQILLDEIDGYLVNYNIGGLGQLTENELYENIIHYENSLINIPSVVFDSSDKDFIASVPGFHNGCSICIEQVNDKEIVKRLPKCGHLYHADCIDSWINTHSECPVCRKNIS